MKAVERPSALGHEILASLEEQAQRLGGGLGIYPLQPFVARGCKRGGEGIELVVLAGVAAG
jgi:hypothetical protein